MKNNRKLLLVDGMGLLFRAYYATATSGYFMYNDKGVPTNGVNGFLKHIFTAVNYFNPSHMAVCWDMGKKTFRNELYPDYKGNRPEPPEQLIPQFDLAKEAAAVFDIPNIGVSGYEADDCLGTVAAMAKEEADVLILTGDQDILQILDDRISVALLKKGYGNYEVFTKENFMEERGYHPVNLVDVKGLTGDTSDHYPGVKGIGPKTAEKLIREYGTVEKIIESLPELKSSVRSKIEKEMDSLVLSRKLAEIKTNVPLEFSLESSKITFYDQINLEAVRDLNIRGIARLLDMIDPKEQEENPAG